jgi:GntR family transcriptional regulator/MocR family aminotransferase
LRESIAHYLNSARGVRCDADQILVVSGTQQSLDLCARLLLSEGDSTVVEDPGYIGAGRVLEAAGGNVIPVPVDDEGIVLTQARRLAPAARLIHVTPAHQAPTGAVLPLQRRRELLAWAGAIGAWVFEDDYDSEYRYSGRPIPALHGLDAEDCVLHAGSFSKTMFPALRLGYLVVPSSLSQGFSAARSNLDRYPSILHQAAMATFLADGHYARHLRRMRLIYAQRHAALKDAVHRHAQSLLELAPHPAGLETVGWLPDGVDDTDVGRRLLAAGLRVEPVSRYRRNTQGRPGLVLGFAAFAPEIIEKGVIALARALRTAMRKPHDPQAVRHVGIAGPQ